MWHGRKTPELEKLNEEYEKIFGCYPDEYDELDYGDSEYVEYVRDIKEAIEKNIELPNIVD